MPYCYHCGVEVDEKVRRCPLCQKKIIVEETEPEAYPYPADPAPFSRKPPLTANERLGLARNITTLGLLIPLLILLTTDYVISGQLLWSPIPVISLVMVWGIVMLPLYFPTKAFIIIGGSTLILCLYLFILQLFTGGHWYFSVGLPLAFLLGFCSQLIVIFAKASHKSGYIITASILTGIVLFCLGCDLVLHYYLTETFGISWSLIIIGAITPIILLILYLGIFTKRKNFIKRFFHI